jgi:hypothetical protein
VPEFPSLNRGVLRLHLVRTHGPGFLRARGFLSLKENARKNTGVCEAELGFLIPLCVPVNSNLSSAFVSTCRQAARCVPSLSRWTECFLSFCVFLQVYQKWRPPFCFISKYVDVGANLLFLYKSNSVLLSYKWPYLQFISCSFVISLN